MNSNDVKGYGDTNDFKFPLLTESQKILCERLDYICRKHGLEMMPSKMFWGAICVSDIRLRHNPDWLSQGSNSLREILYPFCSKERKGLQKKALTKASAIKNRDFEREIGTMFNLLNGLAHHGNSDKSKLSKTDIEKLNFDQLIADFEILIREALKRQLDIYQDIDNLLKKGFKNANKNKLKTLINANTDAKDYFFTKVSIEWILWFYENGFFDTLNIEAEDKTKYSYKMPELDYLRRVVELNGNEQQVLKIMKVVKCDKNFNPEVVDQFLYIAQKLSVENLVKIIPKIEKENWIGLMKNFNISGFSFESIVKKLLESKEYENLILLAKAMLKVDKDQLKANYSDQYFYMTNIHDSGIFKTLNELKGKYAEDAIKMLSEILEVLVVKEKNIKENKFIEADLVNLWDIDFFNLKSEDESGLRYKIDIQSLFNTFIELIKTAIGDSCDKNARKVFDLYIKTLPDSQNIWRIKLFAMAQCPKIFEKELKKELNRPFKTEKFADFLANTEYYHAIKQTFCNWSESEQKKYIKNVFDYFSKKITENPDKTWIKKYGWEILSTISENLTSIEEEDCEKHFGFKPNAEFKPKPLAGEMRSGVVADQSPTDFRDNKYININEIIKDLKGPLSPEKLKEKYKRDDFRRPRNAEGLGNALKENVKLRISDYLAHANDFLDSKINIHYTYSFLRGIEEYLQKNKNTLNNEDWDNIFKLFDKIKEFDKNSVKENYKENTWLARWTWLEKRIASILKLITTEDFKELFKEKRDQILELIKYLLKSIDPTPGQESAKNGGDLFTVAINSTRGIAFEALVNFIYLDGEKLKTDISKFYHHFILLNASLSVQFLIGRYLASFFYRDKRNVKNYYKKIFPTDDENLEKFLAVWEGYLSSLLYKDLFEDLEEYYKYALCIKSSKYPTRRMFKDLDVGIGAHLALAFAHFKDIKYIEEEKHPLLEALFKSDVNKQKEFVSFLGRGIISRGKEWLVKNKIDLEKLKKLWELLLNEPLDPEVYSGFGFWIRSEKDVFKDDAWLAEMMAETLTRSNGAINWEHGLYSKLHDLAKTNPKKTLIILKKYLLDGILGSSPKWFHLDNQKIEVFKILYKKYPKETEELINELLEKEGRKFRALLKIVKK